MNISLNSVDRSSIITLSSIRKKDELNSQVDTLAFDIVYNSAQTFRPETNVEVIATDGATRTFGGKVNLVNAKSMADGSVQYHVECKDYSYDLDRMLVNEEYLSMSVEAVIADIVANYAADFTYANVSCPLLVTKVVFDRVSVTAALQKLADLTGYSWYVDYYKDIHFIETNTELAPFTVSDGDGNSIDQSLNVSIDLSQLRNRVFVKGGEIEGASRTETFNGDTVKFQFKLSNKFSVVPTVTVGGVSKTVGVDYLDNEADFDCFWDYTQQYVRFKTATIPGTGTNNISVAGIPLYNLVVQVEEPDSIAEYGVFEHSIIDKTLKSRSEAVALAKTQLTTYKNGLIDGSFETYVPGLRSGQIITVTSTLLNVNESFLIQSVSMHPLTNTTSQYSVRLATLRSIGIVQYLIDLLKSGSQLIEDKGTVVVEKTVFPQEYITFNEGVDINTNAEDQADTLTVGESTTVQALDYAIEFVAGPMVPTGTQRVFITNGSRLV